MKKVRRLVSILIAGMAVIALSLIPAAQTDAAADGVTLAVTPSKTTVNVDREFTVTVSASEIQNAGGLTFVLNFDKSNVQYVSGTVKNLFTDYVTINKTVNAGWNSFQSGASDKSAASGYLGFYFLNTAVKGGCTVPANTPLLSAAFKVVGAGDPGFSIDLVNTNATCAQAAVIENGTAGLVTCRNL